MTARHEPIDLKQSTRIAVEARLSSETLWGLMTCPGCDVLVTVEEIIGRKDRKEVSRILLQLAPARAGRINLL